MCMFGHFWCTVNIFFYILYAVVKQNFVSSFASEFLIYFGIIL